MPTLLKQLSFSLMISLVNVNKSVVLQICSHLPKKSLNNGKLFFESAVTIFEDSL